jgi:hypothetical protein
MSTFAEEANQAFGEVESEGMPVDYLLSNDLHTGIVRQIVGQANLTEPGFEPVNHILIVTTVAQFDRAPDDGAREVVQIMSGPYTGNWVLIGVTPSVAHYELTCAEAE